MNWRNIFKRNTLPKSISAKEMADSLLKYTKEIYQKNIKEIEEIIYSDNLAEDKKRWCEWEMIFAWYSIVYLTADMTMWKKKIMKRTEVRNEMAKSYLAFISKCASSEADIKSLYNQTNIRIDAYYRMMEIEDPAGWVGSMSKLLLSLLFTCHSYDKDLESLVDYLADYLSWQGKNNTGDIPRMTVSLFLESNLFLMELFMQFIEVTNKILNFPLEII